MNNKWIIENWEQDWDNETLFHMVTPTGTIKKYDVVTGETFEYAIESAVH